MLRRCCCSCPFVLLALSLSPLAAFASSLPLKPLIARAEAHEKNFEWDKACEIYENLLRQDKSTEVKDRYYHCLRRFYQTRRLNDFSYRKEILSLDYAQALKLYGMIRDTLLENSIEKKKAQPGLLFRKGIEELEAALSDPIFLQNYIPAQRLGEVAPFRAFLGRLAANSDGLTRPQTNKQLREVALTAQSMLQLSSTVVIMEFACGACNALDEYTAYLTPNQLRELLESLKGKTGDDFLPSVAFHMKNEWIGYIHIACFQESTLQEIDEAIGQLSKADMKALILDLRGNPGGLFEVAIDVAKRFLSSGVIASTENSDPKFNQTFHARGTSTYTAPLVVLIDSDTASAAEVLAGALKENERARLIGQATFGKGCTQCIVKLPPAAGNLPTGGIRLTIARFYSPKGQPYAGRGIIPDLLAERPKPEGMMMLDPSLTEALNDFQRQFMMGMAIR